MTAQQIVKRKFKGFTLIELLIVITIIGILATFVIASFGTAQAKARDGRRKADLDALKKALELYKGDTAGGAGYPGCPGTPPVGNGGAATGCSVLAPDSPVTTGHGYLSFAVTPLSAQPYFGTSFPSDPQQTGTTTCGGTVATANNYAGNFASGGNTVRVYCYYPYGSAIGAGNNIVFPNYVLSACLENKNDNGGNTFAAPASAKCASDGTDGRTYGIANP